MEAVPASVDSPVLGSGVCESSRGHLWWTLFGIWGGAFQRRVRQHQWVEWENDIREVKAWPEAASAGYNRVDTIRRLRHPKSDNRRLWQGTGGAGFISGRDSLLCFDRWDPLLVRRLPVRDADRMLPIVPS